MEVVLAVEKKFLKNFLKPRSIAIVGASSNLNSISGKPLRFLKAHGYKGKVFPINPKYDEIEGLKCYPSLLDLPETPDLVLVAINYKMVIEILKQCAEIKAKYVAIYSSGFAEVGEEGKKLQEKILKLCKETGIRILGPNCQGLVNLHDSVCASFSGSLELKPLIPGGIGFVTQSGALGYSIFNLMQEAGIGISYIVSTGNEADLNTLDFLEYMVEDSNTKALVAYLESIKDGKQFSRIADRALELCKPIITLKVGRTEIGQKAAASHTASLTGSEAVFDAFVDQKGIIRVEDIEDIIDLAGLIENNRMPKGKKLGIVTTSGGAGILVADQAVSLGLEVPEIPEETQKVLSSIVPDYGSTNNPVDVTAQVINDPEGFSKVLSELTESPEIDGLVIVVTMITGKPGEKMAQDIVNHVKKCDKPIVVAWTAGEKLMGKSLAILKSGKIPCFTSPIRAVNALGLLMKYIEFRNNYLNDSLYKKGISASIEKVRETKSSIDSPNSVLSEHESKIILEQYGIPITRETVVSSLEEAIEAACEIGFPVALKIDSPDIPHKTEANAIKLNLNSREEVEKAYKEIMKNVRNYNSEAKINGMLVQEMVKGGREVIVGVNNDPQFGPVVMFGLGGIFVEIIKDVSMRIAPVSKREAMQMIQETKGFKVLQGARGSKPADLDALCDVLVKVSQLAVADEEISELDLNPILVLPEGQGVRVADALIIRN